MRRRSALVIMASTLSLAGCISEPSDDSTVEQTNRSTQEESADDSSELGLDSNRIHSSYESKNGTHVGTEVWVKTPDVRYENPDTAESGEVESENEVFFQPGIYVWEKDIEYHQLTIVTMDGDEYTPVTELPGQTPLEYIDDYGEYTLAPPSPASSGNYYSPIYDIPDVVPDQAVLDISEFVTEEEAPRYVSFST